MRRFLKIGLLLVFATSGFGLGIQAQSSINPSVLQGMLPAGPYQRCQQVYFVGHEIFDVANGCDSMRVERTSPSSAVYLYRASVPPGSTHDYTGSSVISNNPSSSPKDTVYWVIPSDWIDGTYEVKFFDDEDCDDGPANWASYTGLTFTVSGSLGAPPQIDLGYGGADVFCLGEGNQMPSHTLGVNTSHISGTYLDLTSSGPGDNAIVDSNTGEIGVHSGVANGPHAIQYTDAFSGCSYVDTIEVKTMGVESFDYGGTTFCKSNSSIPTITPPVSPDGVFSISPNVSGAINTTTGEVSADSLPAGAYTITYTPHPDTCRMPYSVNISLTELDSAIFYFREEYCAGDPIGGWPDSIRALPTGYFALDSAYQGGTLVMDSTTGKINLVASSADTFIIEYVPTSGCSVTKYDTAIVRAPLAAFCYYPDSIVCSNYGLLIPDTFTVGGGPFSLVSGFLSPPNSSTGEIDINASQPGGPYTISMGNGDLFCPDTIQKHITILQQDTAAVIYPSGPFCQNDADPVPFFTLGSAGGTFIIGGGAIIDDSTGTIDLSASPEGNHPVTYETGGASCPDTLNFGIIKIDSVPIANFNLFDTAICKLPGLLHPIDSVPPAQGSNFWVTTLSGTPVPGAISTNNLVLDSIAAGGPYRLIRETISNAGCRDTFIDYFVVWPEEDANFLYDPDRYCTADQDPSPLILGDGGGTFSNDSTSTLFINDTTGVIDLDLSRGTHLIEYRTGGNCPDSATTRVVVEDANSPLFSFTQNVVCLDTADTVFVIADSALLAQGHYFTITALNPGSTPTTQALADAALDSDSGHVDLGLLLAAMDTIPENPDTFRVTLFLTLQVGACTDSFSRFLYVYQPDALSSSLGFPGVDNSYCQSEDTTSAILTGTSLSNGNFFSEPPFLVWENRDSGIVALDNTPENTYEILFIKTNACRDTLRDTIVVEAPQSNSLSYADSIVGALSNVYCHGDTIPAWAVLENSAVGTYSYSTGDTSLQLVFIPPDSGHIDLVNSDPGNYVITFSESAGCPGSATATFILQPGPINTSLEIEPKDTFCVGTPIKIVSRGGQKWTVMIDGDTIGNSKELEYPIDINSPTLVGGEVISVEISDVFECSVTEVLVPTINPIPDGLPIPPTVAITGQDPIDIPVGTTAPQTTFSWYVDGRGSIESFSVDQDSIFIVDPGNTISVQTIATLVSSITPGVATFYITPHALGCDGDEDTVVVRINPNDLPIFVPEVFTPDGNTFNDTWEIQWSSDVNPSDYDILVYNRQGGQVFYMPELNSDWNGGSLPDGVYWYNVRSKLTNQTVQKGGVTIRRR